MSTLVLSSKGAKLMKLCETIGFRTFDQLLRQATAAESICPAICMTEGCDHTTEIESDQDHGYCEVCGGNAVTSVLVLAGLKAPCRNESAEESEDE